MEKKLDLRVQKTHRNLVDALIALLSEKTLHEITVTQLCDRAQTRKATFYKHFADKYELFVFAIQEVQRKYEEYCREIPGAGGAGSYYVGIFLYYMNFIEQHETMILKMIQDRSHMISFDILDEQIRLDLTQHLKEDVKNGARFSAPPDLLAVMFTGVIVSSGRWWILQKPRMDKNILARHFETLVQGFQNA